MKTVLFLETRRNLPLFLAKVCDNPFLHSDVCCKEEEHSVLSWVGCPTLGTPDQEDFSQGHEPPVITVPLTPFTQVLGHLVREGISKAIKSAE